MASMQLQDIVDVLEQLAPPELAESWDNVGLLLGDRKADVDRILTCLTLTPDVAEEAVRSGAQLVVTHHPVLFKAVQRLTTDTAEGRTLLTLLRGGVAVYSPHTAWDNAPLGINQQLAERLDLSAIQPLKPLNKDEVKLVTFVPPEHLLAVQQAVWDAGGGVIGNYRQCSFVLEGTGTFFGDEAANPAVGQAGRLERVAEARVEVVCPTMRLSAVLSALRSAHPYEEPAIDVYPLRGLPAAGWGSGRQGALPAPLTLCELAQRVAARLPGARVEMVGPPERSIVQVGIACGAAAEYWKEAQRQGCQVLLTGEARFHTAVEVRDAGFALILAGHYATERLGMERLAQLLAERCAGISVSASAVEHDPLRACP
jgi:dinuclear metal center YbgI/SA1388 family protein